MPTESRADGRAKGEAEVIQPHGEAAFVPSVIFSSWQSKVQFAYVEAYRTGELRGDSIPQL